MRNTNGRKTASIAIPTTRFAAYLVQPATDLVLKDNSFGRVVGEYFAFPAVDTPKSKDVPPGLSGIHRKNPYGAGTGRFWLHYTLTGELRKRSFGSRRSGERAQAHNFTGTYCSFAYSALACFRMEMSESAWSFHVIRNLLLT